MTETGSASLLPAFMPGVGAMLFHAVEYLLVFMPLVVGGYFLLARFKRPALGIAWLLLASLFFYGCWSAGTLWLITASVLVNYVAALGIHRAQVSRKLAVAKSLLFLAVAANLGLLGYFKYAGFFVGVVNNWFGFEGSIPAIALPLGISFFTFTQIAFLVDVHRQQAKEYSFLNYCLFVTYFPHLIAGPILHHKEMMPQFEAANAQSVCWRNVYVGFFIVATGVLKKVVLADGLALQADAGFGQVSLLSWHEAWLSSLSYTLQLYFDFSGYTDMAIGTSLILNIRLPENFNSPYKATSIQDFWRRWHMTLSRWLRDYLYIPLGGSHHGEWRTYAALMLTFLLGGLWHGAGWTFIAWGGLHGGAVCIHRAWQKTGMTMPTVIGWVLTFGFVNLAWVFFRAETIAGAWLMVRSLTGDGQSDAGAFWAGIANGFADNASWNPFLIATEHNPARAFTLVVVGLCIVWFTPNMREWQSSVFLAQPTAVCALAVGLWVGLALFCASFMNVGFSKFIYFYF